MNQGLYLGVKSGHKKTPFSEQIAKNFWTEDGSGAAPELFPLRRISYYFVNSTVVFYPKHLHRFFLTSYLIPDSITIISQPG
ncbi:hypothetical protein T4D_11373 [Trichinella pseudospiralis]|uniref:Uncharacterized protein n=1 Tax=Trichinella pseudospiralis TaxID=6337 RepID=A0A0V1F512_TRIPS|nr:hypothetical protein T4D_11373 [Trichinella pseudospiralis]